MSLTIRQQVAARPGCLYSNEPREVSFKAGALFSFPLHSTLYDEDAAQIRIPKNVKLSLNTASVDRYAVLDPFQDPLTHVCPLFLYPQETNGGLLENWNSSRSYAEDLE
mmetsp:Transcript_12984/g.29633  ORF Transcript_12984/g.29633 Transcript_12984/m.29633 type:complete len:109 (-) Transcript_12984:239-565(-)